MISEPQITHPTNVPINARHRDGRSRPLSLT